MKIFLSRLDAACRFHIIILIFFTIFDSPYQNFGTDEQKISYSLNLKEQYCCTKFPVIAFTFIGKLCCISLIPFHQLSFPTSPSVMTPFCPAFETPLNIAYSMCIMVFYIVSYDIFTASLTLIISIFVLLLPASHLSLFRLSGITFLLSLILPTSDGSAKCF